MQVHAGRLGALDQLDHGAADFLQMAVVHARADVHVQAGQHQAAGLDGVQRGFQFAVPDAVLAVLAAGVGLVAVAVAEAGVDAQPDMVALGAAASWCSMSMEPAFTGTCAPPRWPAWLRPSRRR
jgi:hypothetical protein